MPLAPLPPAACLVRAVPATYTACLRTSPVAIDMAAAREQHASYVSALRETGIEVVTLPADDACPDCCFIEDCAVVTGRHALATRPGAPSRRGEVPPVAQAVARWCEVHPMEPPARLDGGDVLRVGARLFVGLSARTDAAGADQLARVAERDRLAVVRVPVAAGLHLKSLCSLAAPSLLVHAPSLDPSPFRAAGLECVETAEPAGANVLWLGDRVLVSGHAPRTAELLRARGLAVRVVEVGEFHKGDGALTCLSIRVPAVGGWTT